MPSRQWRLIAEVVLTGTGAITFSAIPQTPFDHLMLVGQVRSARAATSTVVGVRFNADTGATYSRTALFGTVASTATVADASTSIHLGTGIANTATAGYASLLTMEIPGYRKTAFNKNTISHLASRVPLDEVDITAGLWGSTAAITRIDLWDHTAAANSWVAGSHLSLLGM